MNQAGSSFLAVRDGLPAALPVPLFAAAGTTSVGDSSLPASILPVADATRGRVAPRSAPFWRSFVVHGVFISVIWGLSAHPGQVLHQVSSSGVATGALLRASLMEALPKSTSPSRLTTPAAPGTNALPMAEVSSATRHAVLVAQPVSAVKSLSVASTTRLPVSQSKPAMNNRSAPKTTSVAQGVVTHRKPPVQKESKLAVATLPVVSSASPVPQPAVSAAASVLTVSKQTATTAVGSPVSAAASTSASAEPAGGPVITEARYLGPPPQLEYPAMARRLGQQGRVVVEVWLDATGQVLQSHILVSPGIPALERAALRYVAASRFAPYTRDGLGHAARLHLSVDFRLH